MKKRRKIDQVKDLQNQNYDLRKKISSGEERRRAAVNEIIDLNRRLTNALSDRTSILMTHQATIISLAKKMGTEVAPGVWEITFLAANPADLLCHTIQAAQNERGEITVRISEDRDHGETE